MRKLIFAISLVLAVGLVGCDEETTRYIKVDDAPAVPQGVYSITGDEAVYIFWLPVRDADLDYYKIWWSPDDDLYELIGTTQAESFTDTDVVNGTTYYYAVSSVDEAGNESALSYESVFDTPRPEGTKLFLRDFNTLPNDAGFDFSEQATVSYDSVDADIYVEYDTTLETFFVNVGNAMTDIQDMGYTYDFDEIGYAPDTVIGWSAVGWAELIINHTYIIWTSDNHYAKVRPYNIIGTTGAQFQWAYQGAVGNPELARPQHDDGFLRRTIDGVLIK